MFAAKKSFEGCKLILDGSCGCCFIFQKPERVGFSQSACVKHCGVSLMRHCGVSLLRKRVSFNSRCRYDLMAKTTKRQQQDGISSLQYHRNDLQLRPLFTHIKVELLEKESKERLRKEGFKKCWSKMKWWYVMDFSTNWDTMNFVAFLSAKGQVWLQIPDWCQHDFVAASDSFAWFINPIAIGSQFRRTSAPSFYTHMVIHDNCPRHVE